MSRHEGVSCDSCGKNNFTGKRFKCLICYDYDLCAQCYDSGASTTRHTKDHPMQCILTRSDFELYYGGEALTIDQPQSFCCPLCGKLGFTESNLIEHVMAEHPDSSTEVVCPICAALPRGDPNHVTDDFLAHLTMEHKSQSIRDFDEPTGSRVRRILHGGRSLGPARTRRSTANQNIGNSSSTTPQLVPNPPSVRDTIDPIAELLSQLSGVRRSAQQSQQSVQSQLQLLQQQLQFERQQVQQTRERLERLPRRPMNTTAAATTSTTQPTSRNETSNNSNSSFLLTRCCDNELKESEEVDLGTSGANRSLFVQDLIVSTLKGMSPEDLSSINDENLLNSASGISDTLEGDDGKGEPSKLAEDLELINLDDVDEKDL